MGFDVWLEFRHKKISKEDFERIKKKIPNIPEELKWEDGYLIMTDVTRSPDYDAVIDLLKEIAKTTGEPAFMLWQQDDYHDTIYVIATPDGKAFESEVVFETDLGTVSSFDEYLRKWREVRK